MVSQKKKQHIVVEPHLDRRGPWSPKSFGNKLVCIYRRVILIDKCYIYNIFTIYLQQILSGKLLLVVTGK